MNEKQRLLSMLGLCRKANRICLGHDAGVDALQARRAKLCLLAADASPRLCREFEREGNFDNRNVPVMQTALTMEEIYGATGSRAGVLTILDEGFANKIAELCHNMTREEYDD